eukprot:TRINITY_DN295_c0_g1_i2.p1 TRINITY_DN295_c0_g1~~TRINITY_DN295_c0_g1_i2.p1  ORF type:complete len:576 (-),score=140.38 TRINITY_DN295_c0_g1_i2:42-1769(-)
MESVFAKDSMAKPRSSEVAVLTASFVGSLVLCYHLCGELRSRHAYGDLNQGQIAFGMLLSLVCSACVACEATLWMVGPAAAEGAAEEKVAIKGDVASTLEGGRATDGYGSAGAASDMLLEPVGSRGLGASLQKVREPLRAGAELAGILGFMYVCDRTHFFAEAQKNESVSIFWAVWGCICLASLLTIRELKAARPLAREQTDEWRGWMQLMFLLYHYFHYENIYNAIRVYIAGYVMMTGFGNFIYYRKTDDFSPRRILQMLFRLNFLGFCVCVALNNEFMLYYICPMHTFFTVLVILALFVGRSYNQSTVGVWVKVAVIAAITVLVYDGPAVVFNTLFDAVPYWKRLFVFHDPLHPEFTDEMHEWHFRSGLDRFNWVFGMIIAMHVPQLGFLLERIDSMTSWRQHAARGALAALVLAVGAVWLNKVFLLDKYDYNKLHPFTSFIPLVLFIVLRNFTVTLRQHYIYLFAWVGQYTLETYILQFHVWMRTTGVNGSPKSLIAFVPGDNFYLNFVIGTAIYFFLSIRFFKLTGVLKDALIPSDGCWRPAALLLVLGSGAYVAAGLQLVHNAPTANNAI